MVLQERKKEEKTRNRKKSIKFMAIYCYRTPNDAEKSKSSL